MPDTVPAPASPAPAQPTAEPTEPVLRPDPALVVQAWQNMPNVTEQVRQALKTGAQEYARAGRQAAFVHDYVGGLREMMIFVVMAHRMTRRAASIVADYLIAQEQQTGQ